MALEAIKYERGAAGGRLRLLDQRLLPFEQKWLEVPTPEVAWAHIKDMVVRGAPVRRHGAWHAPLDA
jgi:methylthioribose-1-phosphate isomerase